MTNHRIITNWRPFYPAEVVTPITVQTQSGSQVTAGNGTVKIFWAYESNDPAKYYLEEIPSEETPDIWPVFRHDFGPEVPVGARGYVVQDNLGVLWWLNQDTNLIRFTLEEDLDEASESTAAALINSDGEDNDESITVTNWARTPARIGAKGIAWLSVKIEAGSPVKTYYVLQIDSPGIVRFTLTSDLLDESTASATINSAGEDDGDPIEVTRWSVATEGKIGDRGIAWKQGDTFYVIELSQTTQLIRFTLTSDLQDESTADATINSTGEDDGDPIEVTRWSVATEGKIGDRGIAWKQGETYWILELAQTTQLVRFTLLSRMMDETEADASINSTGPEDGDLITVTRWSRSTQGEIGDRGIAWKQGDFYIILELSNSDNSIVFQATTTPTFGAFNDTQTFDAVVLAADNSVLVGETVPITTVGRTRVKAGMRGSACLIGLTFIATELQQPAILIRGTLVGNLLPADTDASITVNTVPSQFPNDVPPSTATITADNPLQLKGFQGAKVVLHFDANDDKYFIGQVTEFADRIVGSVGSDFESDADEINLTGLNGLNGVLSPELVTAGSATAQNTHAWNGKAGGRARAEYNWTAEQWELYQIDCAEEQGAPPGSGPGAGGGGGA